jgi:hypothetical protein
MEEEVEGRQKHLNIKFQHFKEGIKKETNQHIAETSRDIYQANF